MNDLDGWASWSDAGVLQAIQDGYRLSRGHDAIGTDALAQEAAQKWATFFSEFPAAERSERKRLWAPAEQAGVDYGIALADARPRGRGGPLEAQLIADFVQVGNLYRALASVPQGGEKFGAAVGTVGGVPGVYVGYKTGGWFTTPTVRVPGTSHGPTYYSAWYQTLSTTTYFFTMP